MSNGFAAGIGSLAAAGYLPQSATAFPDPFQDMASLAMPETMLYANRWCEYLMYANGTYFRALDRVVSYFLTKLEIVSQESEGLDDDERQAIADYINDVVGMLQEVHIGALNYTVYGNEFLSVINPFVRYLNCPQCNQLDLPLREVYNDSLFSFKWQDLNFHAKCPKCDYSGVWNHKPRQAPEDRKPIIRHWSPHEIDLLWDPYTDEVRHIWKIPEDYRRVIREGELIHLENANWEVVEAIRRNQHLLFDKDVIHHMKEPTLAGIRNRGWGISRVLSNFRQAWYVQVLHRYNEAIALDYVIPFRLITPAPGPGSSDQAKDSLLNLNMGGMMAQIQRMVRGRRRDPAGWHTLPFPVQYQALGGDATQLAPRDLLDQGLEILLNNAGIPVELFKGTLTAQASVPALRLFQSQWAHLVHAMNRMVDFMMKKIGIFKNWDKITARLEQVTHADDMEKQMAILQLYTGGQLPRGTAFSILGLDWRDQLRKQYAEAEFEADIQAQSNERMQQKAQMEEMAMGSGQGGMPPGQPGMPLGQGAMPAQDPSQAQGNMAQAGQQMMAQQPMIPGQPKTPEEMEAKAQMLAQNYLAMPETQRKSELLQLKRTDSNLHALVIAQMDEMRRQARTVGGAMVMQQQFKQGGVTPNRYKFRFPRRPIIDYTPRGSVLD